MDVTEIVRLTQGKVICGQNRDLEYAFASDLMSDVLTLKRDKLLLITGLTNLQTVRTAEMSDIEVILFVRNKQVNQEMIALAEENGITLIVSPFTMFRACGALQGGLQPIY